MPVAVRVGFFGWRGLACLYGAYAMASSALRNGPMIAIRAVAARAPHLFR